jgi:WD40 repeat protein
MKAIKGKKFSEPIIFYVKQKNSTILIADKTTAVRFLDQQDLETLGGFKANINHTWYKNQVVSFSHSGDYFAVISEDARDSKLYDSSTKKVKQKISRHHGEVSCVAVDPRGKYFFSSGEDGRTFVIDTKSARLLFTLPHHADTINDIKFSKKSYLVATASYDKKIHIFNYGTITPVATLKAHTAPVMKVEFLSQNTLCSVDKSSSAIIWDISTQKVLKRLDGIHDDVVQITSNEHFLFLGTNLGFIIVYDLNTYEQLSRKFIKVNSRITCLEYDDEQNLLVIADDLGELLYFDPYKGLDKIKKYIKLAEYDQAYKLIKKNPLLEFTDSYKKIEEIWDKTYTKAIKLLQESKKEKALSLFGSFSEVPNKNSRIRKLFEEFEEFDKFLLMVKNGKIALAYSLANQHPLYKDSDIYKALEKKWK